MDNQSASQPPSVQSPQQPIENQPQSLSSGTRRSPKIPLLILLLVLIIAGALYGVYAWQHSKVNNLNAQVSSLKSQSDAQTNKITSLSKELSASDKTATSTKASAATAGPFDQTAAINKAVKAYKDNAASKASTLKVTIYGVTASGDAAYGTVSTPGQDGGGAWLAINNVGNWSVVSQNAVGVCSSSVQKYNLPTIWAGHDPIC